MKNRVTYGIFYDKSNRVIRNFRVMGFCSLKNMKGIYNKYLVDNNLNPFDFVFVGKVNDEIKVSPTFDSVDIEMEPFDGGTEADDARRLARSNDDGQSK